MQYLEDLFSLRGKTALVTGGATGIGRMIAAALLQAGASVFIASRNRAACESAAAELSQHGPCSGLGADLSCEQDILQLHRELRERTEKLDILVNSAGTTWGDPLATFPWQAWEKVMSLNVAGSFTLSRELLPLLEAAARPEDPARIVNVGSVVASRPIGNNAYSYAASKAALHHLTRILAYELASRHVTVNALAPGPVATRMLAHVTRDPHKLEQAARRVPLGRFGEADDLAGVTLMLCGRAGRYVSGAIVPIDGGMSAAP